MGDVANSFEPSITSVKPVIDVPAMGLTPRSPVSVVVPVVVMPVLARMTNVDAVPRLTGAGPAPVPGLDDVVLEVDVVVEEPLAEPEAEPVVEPPEPPL